MNPISLNLPPKTLSPYFGWSRKVPPDPGRYLLDVSSANDEFVESGKDSLQPKSALIQRIIHELSDPEGPRFVVLTGLHQNLRLSKKQVHLFQKEVMEQMGKIQGFSTGEDSLDEGKDSKLETSKFFHFDNLGTSVTPVVSLAYGPFKNVLPEEGVPRLADTKQWVEDKLSQPQFWPLKALYYLLDSSLEEKWLQYFGRYKSAPFDSKDPPNETHVELEKNYSIEFNGLDYTKDIPIIFLNNLCTQGVAHGASPFKILQNRQGEIARLLNRVVGLA